MLTDADLPQLSADKTLWYRLDGVYLRGSKQPVELELRWFWTKEHVAARTNSAFAQMTTEEREKAYVSLIAKHLVRNWRNVPDGDGGAEPFDVEGCTKLLWHIHATAPDVWTPLSATIYDPEKFGRPALVDPEALGEG